MIQVLPNRRPPSTGERFKNALGVGLEHLGNYMEKKKAEQLMQQENEAYPSLSGLTDPKMRQIALSEQLKGVRSGEKNKNQSLNDAETYKTVQKAFGDQFADIWKSAPIGGKTELLKHALDLKSRG